MSAADTVIIRQRGVQEYVSCWRAMQEFTQHRDENTHDEIWLLEHPPVFTQGQNGKPEHLLAPREIPVVQVDRGGQVTYHGPGQLVAYTLVDVKRKKLNVRQLVTALEQSVIELLASQGITAVAKREAPGVYVENKKICSIGLRIRRGCAYHGLALNIAMDLSPFKQINPCGFATLEVTQLRNYVHDAKVKNTGLALCSYLKKNLNYLDERYDN